MSENASNLTIKSTERGVSFELRVIPGAKADCVMGYLEGALKVRVAAPPERGKANKSVANLLAEMLNVPKRDITITFGETSQNKTVEIANITSDEIVERLNRIRI